MYSSFRLASPPPNNTGDLLSNEEDLTHFWNQVLTSVIDVDDYYESFEEVEPHSEIDLDEPAQFKANPAIIVGGPIPRRSLLSRHFHASSKRLLGNGKNLSYRSILGGSTSTSILQQDRDEAIGAIFDRLDLDGDGLLNRTDLQAMLKDAAATIQLRIDDAVIDAAIDALLDDVTTKEAQRSVEISYIVGEYNANDESMMTLEDDPHDCINKAQFSDIFKRHPDMLRVFLGGGRRKELQQQEQSLQDVEQEESENEQTWRATWKNWKVALFWLTLYLVVNVVAFAFKAHKYAHHRKDAQAVFGQCIIVARGAAQCLNLNCALILLPMARHLMTRLRATPARHYFPFDHISEIHSILGLAILFWTVVHVGAHVCDIYNMAHHATEDEIHAVMGDKMGHEISDHAGDRWKMALELRASVTGIIMVLCMVVAYPVILYRRKYFNTFWNTHHLLLVMLIVLCLHGNDGLLEPTQSTYWIMVPFGLYLVPRLLRETYCSQTSIIDAKIKNGGVLCLRLQKPAHWDPILRSGMYAFIQVPAVSRYEWHPFTLTSCKIDPYLEFHIRNAGDWTNALHEYVRSLEDNQQRLSDSSILLDSSEQTTKSSSALFLFDLDGGSATSSFVDDLEEYDHRVIRSACNVRDSGVRAKRASMGFASSVVAGAPPPRALREMVVKVEGPIGASSQGFKDYPILVLVGAGIGVTPMISVLKQLLSNPRKMQRVFFYWTVRDRDAFEWFSDIMDKVYLRDTGHILQIRHFLTSVKDDDRDIGAVLLHHATRAKHRADGFDLILGQQTHHHVEVGRPKWEDELRSVKQEAKDLGQKKCGIFLCGPDKMAESIQKVCNAFNAKDKRFHFHFSKETF